MKFYFDENIPEAIARALNELEKGSDNLVKSTIDIWGRGIKDPQLIEGLNKEDGILVTNDLKMKRLYYELLKENKVTAFFIVFPSGASFALRYRQIFKIWEKIKETIQREPRPFCCKIQVNGTTTILK